MRNLNFTFIMAIVMIGFGIAIIGCGDQPTINELRSDLTLDNAPAAPSFGDRLLLGYSEDDGYYKIGIKLVNWPTFHIDRPAMEKDYDRVVLTQFMNQEQYLKVVLNTIRTTEANFLANITSVTDPEGALPDRVVAVDKRPEDRGVDRNWTTYNFTFYKWDGKFYGVVYTNNQRPAKFPAPDGFRCETTTVNGRTNLNFYKGNTLLHIGILGGVVPSHSLQMVGDRMRHAILNPGDADLVQPGNIFDGNFAGSIDKICDKDGILDGIIHHAIRVCP